VRGLARIQRLEQKLALERERARIAHDIHDDLGSRLSQLSVLGELAYRHLDHPGAARPHVEKLTAASKDIFQAMDEIVWAVNPKEDSLIGLVSYLREYSTEILGPAGIHCRLEFPNPVPAHNLTTDVRHHLFLVVKEALNNVIKHARATEVRVCLAVPDRTLTLTVEDNGRGFQNSGEAGSLAEAEKSERSTFNAQLSTLNPRGTATDFIICATAWRRSAGNLKSRAALDKERNSGSRFRFDA